MTQPSDDDKQQPRLDFGQLLACFQSQLSELDLLQSMYPCRDELAIDDCAAVDELRRLTGDCEAAVAAGDDAAALSRLSSCNWRIGFTFRVSLLAANTSSLECICRLPASYPLVKPPGLFLRSDSLNRDQLRNASECLAAQLESSFTCGEPVLYGLFSWLSDFAASSALLSEQQDVQSSNCASSAASASDSVNSERLCRVWIHSHHIYSCLKRRDILDWSAELALTGFSIVGKPGVVCAEGPEGAVEEFWQRLRRLNWKKLTMKEKDVCPANNAKAARTFRKFADFREIGFNARPGKGREVLQDWGLVIRFLEDKGLGHVIPLYFGNIR